MVTEQLTFLPEDELLGLGLAVARDSLFRGFEAALNIVTGDATRELFHLAIIDLYVLLHVASPTVLVIPGLERRGSRLEQRLLGADGGVDLVLGACGNFFAQLAEPERPVVRDFLFGGHLWLVERIVQPERGRLGRAVCVVRPWLIPLEPVRV